jgi:hypothetical protein
MMPIQIVGLILGLGGIAVLVLWTYIDHLKAKHNAARGTTTVTFAPGGTLGFKVGEGLWIDKEVFNIVAIDGDVVTIERSE